MHELQSVLQAGMPATALLFVYQLTRIAIARFQSVVQSPQFTATLVEYKPRNCEVSDFGSNSCMYSSRISARLTERCCVSQARSERLCGWQHYSVAMTIQFDWGESFCELRTHRCRPMKGLLSDN